MIIPPLALVLGALGGLLFRGRRRAILGLSLAVPVLSLIAMAFQFVPGGTTECAATTSGAQSCRPLPATSGWEGIGPYSIAVALLLLSFAPLVSWRIGAWWPAAVSAVLQAVAQVISFGGFLDWTPALLLTVTVAFAVAWTPVHARAPGQV